MALADLGRVYLELSRRGPAEVRADRCHTATTLLEKSATLWRAAKLSAAAEPRRTRALTSIAQSLEECRRVRPLAK
jgi:hypothetical protein